ncbi:methylated-DNA--[protein]-cysteine S-methyltransferase [soil metagenome]
MKLLMVPSPVGPLLVEYDAAGVQTLRFWRQGEHPPAGTRDAPARSDAMGSRIRGELEAYFSPAGGEFTVPVNARGTAFQREVWDALRRIPCGATCSYAQLAADVGRPGAPRAVGQANARNPIPILIPCHRVVASDGSLGGYMGDWGMGEGLAIKRWLLGHEGA